VTRKTPSRIHPFVVAAAVALAVAPTIALASGFSFWDFFVYPNGNLVGQGGWAAHSGAGNKPIQVTAGEVVLQQNAGSGEDANRVFPQRLGNVKTYATFKVRVPAGPIGTVNDYFVHFRPAGADSNNFVARTFIGPPTAGGDYVLGIAAGSLTTTPLAPWPTGLTFGQNYRVAIAYDGGTGTSTLWVDPTSELSPSVSSTSAGLANRLLANIAVRQSSPSAGSNYTEVIDSLRVADNFNAASGVVLPSLSQWGAMILAMLLAVTGVVFVVRRRKALA
jgi:hypothetical protein